MTPIETWKDADIRARRSEAITKAFANPAVRKKISDGVKSSWADPEVRARRVAGMRAWAARQREPAE